MTEHVHEWSQYDPDHKHRYRCTCGVLGYKYPRHKEHTVFKCSHTTMQKQGDGSERRRPACSQDATEWHAGSPYCTKHKPIPRGMGEEVKRLEAVKRERVREARRFAESMLPVVFDRYSCRRARLEAIVRWTEEAGLTPIAESDLAFMHDRYVAPPRRPPIRLSDAPVPEDIQIPEAIILL